MLLKQQEKRGSRTEGEIHQIVEEMDYLEKKCNVDTMHLDHFLNKLYVKESAVACKSSLLQMHYEQAANKMSASLEASAKQVLALHTKENRLGHHFVAHLQELSSQGASDKFEQKVNEVLTGNITRGQRLRLHRLDQHPELRRVKDARCADQKDHRGVLTDYKQCLCDDGEPSVLCHLQHKDAIEQHSKWIQRQFEPFHEVMQRRADQPAVAPVGSDNSSVQLAQSGAGVWTIGPCGPTADWLKSAKLDVCMNGHCLSFPYPASLSEKDLKDSEKVLGRKTNVFGFFKKAAGGLSKDEGKKTPCLSTTATLCIALEKFAIDVLSFKLGLGVELNTECGVLLESIDSAIMGTMTGFNAHALIFVVLLVAFAALAFWGTVAAAIWSYVYVSFIGCAGWKFFQKHAARNASGTSTAIAPVTNKGYGWCVAKVLMFPVHYLFDDLLGLNATCDDCSY
ncbi:unnamed protein product [Symbiodinium natans]|uniref:Uncharacterized protein n=1 Tax=Symbiodinium natans TaxID=878477 RepID=A0A812U2Z8_9DINO|nr:unnamed protein product [Symbiodinium natans]